MQAQVTTINERSELLANTTWASDLTPHDLQMLSIYMNLYKVAKGETIFKEGGNNSFLCIIIQGKVQILKENNKSTPTIIATLNAGKSFGEMSILDGEHHSADVVTTEETRLLLLTKEKLMLMISEKPGIGAKLLLKLGKSLSQRLRLMDGKIVDLL